MQRPTIPDAAVPETDPETLVFCFDQWVKKIANRYKNMILKTGASVDLDDLYQAGRLALLRAQRKYDPVAGKSFLSFSFDYLRAAMRYEIQRNKPQPPPWAFVSLDENISEDSDSTFSEIIEDHTIETAQERAERLERAEELHQAIERLKSDKKREIVHKVWFEEKEMSQAAEELNMRTTAAYAAHREALSKLRRDYRLKQLCAPMFNVGISRFRARWESAVEAEILWKEKMFDERFGSGAYLATKEGDIHKQ